MLIINDNNVCSICGAYFQGNGFCANGHNPQTIDLVKFYKKAKEYIIDQGYISEIDMVKNRHFKDQTSESLFDAFVYVVLNSGMKNKIAQQIYERFMTAYSEMINGKQISMVHIINNTVGHPGKNRAIKKAYWSYQYWFKLLKQKETLDEQLEFLQSLPWIGKITKYHLARNLGIDVAKPDRHMVRVAEYFGFEDVQNMCGQLSRVTGDRIGVVDLVLWRTCVIEPDWKNKIAK